MNTLENLHIVAFTHQHLSVAEIGGLHVAPENQGDVMPGIKSELNISELMYLSTCNRIEFTICKEGGIDQELIHQLVSKFPEIKNGSRARFVENAEVFSGLQAIEHLISVASSVKSMVVGEREIITQVRTAFENCRELGLTGDLIRIAMRHTIETAKRVYTETNIARHPVSVVSLAYHQLRDMAVPLDSRILIVGAGVTNTNMSRFLKKHGFTNFHVFNRTLSKAEALAQDLGGEAHSLDDLTHFKEGFDIIITCTGAERHVITPVVYESLLGEDEDKKIVIDIAIPQDLSPRIKEAHNIHHIAVETLQQISRENLAARSKELANVRTILDEAMEKFMALYEERNVEVAMREVPNKVKEIKRAALDEVFKAQIEDLDEDAKTVLKDVISYMEKKYMSMPMLMAKEIMLKNQRK